MRKIILVSFIFILALSFTACAETETYDDDGKEGNIISADSGTLELEDISVYKYGDGSTYKADEYDFYGYNAAILASGDGAIEITSADITTEADYASAVFAYGGGITITSASITTTEKNSGGLMVTGGGIIVAEDVNISTDGDSSAAIRSDRGGGSISATGGTYITSGKGSPAIYSTASISVSNALLTSTSSQGVVIEGGNSVALTSTDMVAYHEQPNGQDKTYQAVLIYQSGSGDASEGEADFTMTNGSITNSNGDIFCVTNTSCDIILSSVDITNNDEDGNFLRAEGQNWGRAGSNGGNVTLIASKQVIEGDILVSNDSSLFMTLIDKSSFTGAFNPDTDISEEDEVSLAAAGGEIYIILEKGSKITLTRNSYITSWDIEDSNDITYGDYSIAVGSNTYNASTPYGKSSGSSRGGGSGGTPTSGDSTIVIPVTSDDIKTVGPANVGCNLGCAGVILLACAALIMKKK